MEIYIKPVRKASIAGQEHVYVKDICEVYAGDGLGERVKNIKLMKTENDAKKTYLISALDIIDAVDKALPGHTINNVGELDTIVEYQRREKTDNAFWKWLKIVLISIIFAVGASTAIMSFHTDAEIPKVFKNYYKIFFGKEEENPRIIQIPYSIGLALGIIVFFNHIGGKKITDDPSPIEVEMSEYDKNVTETLVDFLSVKKIRGGLQKEPKSKKSGKRGAEG